MIFAIQSGNPRVSSVLGNSNSLSELVEDLFPMNTENAIIYWNHIGIPLSYKYDLSYMIDDIIKLLSSVQKNNSGSMSINWLPDTFRCDWKVEWEDDSICVLSNWEHTVGHLERILNDSESIRISTIDFLKEWKSILGKIIEALNTLGDISVDGYDELLEVYNAIDGYGVLYDA